MKKYRLLWNDDGGELGCYSPPVGVDRLKRVFHDRFEGTAVDAYFCALGQCTGYTTVYPTQVEGMDFVLDRYEAGSRLGHLMGWQLCENLKDLQRQGVDWIEFQRTEARKLGMDFWLHLRMNDWHHSNDCMAKDGKELNLLAGGFYVDHPEYLIGSEAMKGQPGSLKSLAAFQDYAHPEVRQLRLSVLEEACEKYDIDGFQYDFMRCPGYFKPGEETAGRPKMTDFIRQSRAILDRIGTRKNKRLGLSVRVPNTIAGSEKLGLDIRNWVRDGLVDLIVPSTFFHADTEEDMTEWTSLVSGTQVGIYPAVEAAYAANHTGGVIRCFYNPPVLLSLTTEMSFAIAANHYRNGADGLYLFNWTRTSALPIIGDRTRVDGANKTYVLMHRDDMFPNCLPLRQLPVSLNESPSQLFLTVADDLKTHQGRLAGVKMWVHYSNLTNRDRIEVKVNGSSVPCTDVKERTPEELYMGIMETWLAYDLIEHLPAAGRNEIEFRVCEREPRVAKEFPLEVVDLEIRVEYSDKSR
jgi:hypothetical protein